LDHDHQGRRSPAGRILHILLLQISKEEAMIKRFHEIANFYKDSIISVLVRKGEEGDFIQKCHDLKKYIEVSAASTLYMPII
jgi:hypothetical protein